MARLSRGTSGYEAEGKLLRVQALAIAAQQEITEALTDLKQGAAR